MYVGPEFLLDSRLAQIISIIWTTYIYSPALPLLLPIGAVNLGIIYWIDKALVVRFNKTPRNYDETLILEMLWFIKLTFPLHFVGGLAILANTAILQSDSVEDQDENVRSANAWAVENFGFNLLSDQFQKVHCITFIVIQMLFMTLLLF